TYKAWDALRFLLERAGCPVDVIFGEEDFTDEDWGYGPARYVTVEQVRTAAAFMSARPFADLARGVTPSDLPAAELSPKIWAQPDVLDWVGGDYAGLAAFFGSAADDGHAMLVWLC